MSRALYHIDKEIEDLLQSGGEDGELTEEIAKQIDELQIELVDKVGSIIEFRRFMEGWADQAKKEEERMKAFRKQWEAKVEFIDNMLLRWLEHRGLKDITTPTGKVLIRTNPPSAEVVGDLTDSAVEITKEDGSPITDGSVNEANDAIMSDVFDFYMTNGKAPPGFKAWLFAREKTIIDPDKKTAIEFYKKTGRAPHGWKIHTDKKSIQVK